MYRLIPLFCPLALLLATSCGGGGRPEGPPVPIPDTLRTVTGRVGYLTTGPRLSNRDEHGRLVPTPGLLIGTIPARAPYIPIEIRRPDGTLLVETLSTPDGRYTAQVNFGQNPATQLIVRARGEIRLPGGAQVRVLAAPASSAPYAYQVGPAGDPDDSTMTIDVTVPLAQGAGAWGMLTVLYPAFLTAAQGLLSGELRDLDVIWSPGNGPDSSFDPNPGGAARITVAGGVAGDPTSNRDEWDEAKVVRLMGEYLLADHFLDVAPEGLATDGSLVPSAAWREGFLDFWACIGRGDRLYWDTEGEGTSGRVVRFFDIESFFDPSLPPITPDDPNVYQTDEVTGIASRFTVAEVLWDIHEEPPSTDDAALDFPVFLTLRLLESAQPGQQYPYLVTLIEAYDKDNSISKVKMDNLLREPENQNIPLLAEPTSTRVLWPRWFSPGGVADAQVGIGYLGQLSGTVDTLTPMPPNPEIGDESQRYFIVRPSAPQVSITARLSTSGDLRVEILDLENNLLATGTAEAIATPVPAGRYLVRVLPDPGAALQTSDFDLEVEVGNP